MGIDLTANQCHSLADQRLRFGRSTGGNDNTAAFIADWQGLPDAACHEAHSRFGHVHRNAGKAGTLDRTRTGHIGCTDHQAQIRRVDRGGLHLHHHFMVLRRRHG